MKRNYFFAIAVLAILFSSCRTDTGAFENGRYSKNLKEGFTEGFKTISFCKCVEYASDRNLKLWEEDASCRFPDYLYTETKVVDSIARNEAEKIRRAEAERNDQRAEGMKGKQIMSSCLAFYNSKVLEAIAHERFKANEKSYQRTIHN